MGSVGTLSGTAKMVDKRIRVFNVVRQVQAMCGVCTVKHENMRSVTVTNGSSGSHRQAPPRDDPVAGNTGCGLAA